MIRLPLILAGTCLGTGLALLGMAFTVLGVALVVTRQPVPAASPAATPAAILAASASPAPRRDA